MDISGQRAFEMLEQMDFPHPSGTKEEEQTAQLFFEAARTCTPDVHIETFPVEAYRQGEGTLEILEPYRASYPVRVAQHSPDTPEGGVTAPLKYTDCLDRRSLEDLRGCLVLANEFDRALKAPEGSIAGYLLAEGSFLDSPEMRTRARHGYFPDAKAGIPGLHIHISDAMDLVRRGASKARFSTSGKTLSAESRNVVADLPGTDPSLGAVIIGAHYDSVPEGPGARDNGAGSVIICELLRAFAGERTRRSLRFVWFGSEEAGLKGSIAYVRAHEQELSGIDLMVNIDVAGSYIGRNHVMVSGDKKLEDYARFLASETGFSAEYQSMMIGSDSTPFAARDIPAITFARGGHSGLSFGHTPDDRIEFVSPKELENLASFVYRFVRRAADSEWLPFERKLPDELRKELEKLQYDM